MSKVLILGEMNVIQESLAEMLEYIGAPDWGSDAPTDNEMLIEIAGRLCYKSFGVGLNPNITRVREGNDVYLGNVMKQKHGSVFEHAYVSVVFLDVSRILTHELVRHRLAAISQESQRFVRLDTFSMYIPELTPVLERLYDETHTGSAADKETWVQDMQQRYIDTVARVKDQSTNEIQYMLESLQLDTPGVSFHTKKQITSALRRFVPGGVNTNIMVSANLRMWRHIIENRTSPGAEQEIGEVMGKLAEIMRERYPNALQDMNSTGVTGDDLFSSHSFTNQKI